MRHCCGRLYDHKHAELDLQYHHNGARGLRHLDNRATCRRNPADYQEDESRRSKIPHEYQGKATR